MHHWNGEPLYLKSLGSEQLCTIDDGDGPSRQVTIGRQYRRGVDLATSNVRVKPGGAFVAPRAGVQGEIACGGDVRVGSGWIVYLYFAAGAGLWVIVPAAAALVIGRSLRKTKSRSPTL